MTSTADMRRTRTALSAAERARFSALLKVAAESPYPGERANALDAARRLAKRHGISLQEAAREPRGSTGTVQMPQRPRRYTAREMAEIIAFSEAKLRADKERYERALRQAKERGLDGESIKPEVRAASTGAQKASQRSRTPHSFAKVLLSETTLPLREIVSLTGLDIYRVVDLKLKMRSAA